MTLEEIQEARKILSAMTMGEWFAWSNEATGSNNWAGVSILHGPPRRVIDKGMSGYPTGDSAGIAYLRNHATAWLDEIDRLRAEWAKAAALTCSQRDEIDRLRAHSQQPTDDAEPVMADWFQSIGGKELTGEGECPAIFGLDRIRFYCDMNHSELLLAYDRTHAWICDDPTRGQVRQLCSILGIQLKEKR